MINSIRKFTTMISPKLNTSISFLIRKKRFPNYKNPITFDDKITWLKLNYYPNNELVKTCADKVEVHDYIKSLGYSSILNEVYGVYTNPTDIDFTSLPESFVVKWNNDFGSTIVIKNKNETDIGGVITKLKSSKDSTFYMRGAEMHYKGIEPKIIVERYLEEENSEQLTDYKIYCYDGKPVYIMVCTGRSNNNTKFYFYDKSWNFLRINSDGKSAPDNFKLEKPKNFDKMLSIAEKISKGFPFVRVDLYNLSGKIIFGEMTFTPASGSDPGLSYDLDLFLGENLKLPI